jgi:hypothetical protein
MAAATSSLQQIASTILSRELPPLIPSSPYNATLSSQISSCFEASDVTKAVLYLCNDDIAGAHNLAQSHEESMTANLTHAILHRREGDYWNSVRLL